MISRNFRAGPGIARLFRRSRDDEPGGLAGQILDPVFALVDTQFFTGPEIGQFGTVLEMERAGDRIIFPVERVVVLLMLSTA